MAGIYFPVAGNGAPSYVLPTATANLLGGVKQGTNVNIDSNGLLSVAPPYIPARTNLSLPTGDFNNNGFITQSALSPNNGNYVPLSLVVTDSRSSSQLYPAGWLQTDKVTLVIPPGIWMLITSLQVVTTDASVTAVSYGMNTGPVVGPSYSVSVSKKNYLPVTNGTSAFGQWTEIVTRTAPWQTQFGLFFLTGGSNQISSTINYSLQIQQLY